MLPNFDPLDGKFDCPDDFLNKLVYNIKNPQLDHLKSDRPNQFEEQSSQLCYAEDH